MANNIRHLGCGIKRTPLRSGRVTQKEQIENLYFHNLFCGTLINMSIIDLATPFKIGMYLLNKEILLFLDQQI